MRLESVTAHAFGPLVAQTLVFAPGLTVVTGLNESAKSSWHAATYAALCGRKRGKGRPARADQRFTDRHRPWDRGDWLVSCVLTLADGRRIELRQDLAGLVDCRARDLVLGLDVSGEIISDGAPDGARWFGLDRGSYLVTGCVRQTDILAVLENAEVLQEHLARAVTAGSPEESAARAIRLLEVFRAEAVGSERTTSGKPLRAALDALEGARRELDEARTAHACFAELLETSQQLDGQAVARRRRAEELRARREGLEALTAAAAAVELHEAATHAVGGTGPAPGPVPGLGLAPGPAPGPGLGLAPGPGTAPGTSGPVGPGRHLGSPRSQRPVRLLTGLAGALAAFGLLALLGQVPLLGVSLLLVAAVVAGAAVANAWARRRTTGSSGLATGASVDPVAPPAGSATDINRDIPAGAIDRDVPAAADVLAQAIAHRDTLAARLGVALAQLGGSPAESLGGLVATAREAWEQAEQAAREALRQAATVTGACTERARELVDVAAAEEAYVAAQDELTRVRELDRVLGLTIGFLTGARDRVHRDLAPVLASSLTEWLPQVTTGRYQRAVVDPATLAVRVAGPDGIWREADRLSCGTAEQIYLLLRVALTRHLTHPDEVAPLLLDEVTVQSDVPRTREILTMLHALAAERQVILFAQDEEVARWADARLAGPADSHVRLPCWGPP